MVKIKASLTAFLVFLSLWSIGCVITIFLGLFLSQPEGGLCVIIGLVALPVGALSALVYAVGVKD